MCLSPADLDRLLLLTRILTRMCVRILRQMCLSPADLDRLLAVGLVLVVHHQRQALELVHCGENWWCGLAVLQQSTRRGPARCVPQLSSDGGGGGSQGGGGDNGEGNGGNGVEKVVVVVVVVLRGAWLGV